MIGYCYSRELEIYASKLPSNLGRSRQIHGLINAYKLFEHENLMVIRPDPASYTTLTSFHTPAYIDAVFNTSATDGMTQEELGRFGLCHDCPVFAGLPQYVSLIAGASVSAARALIENRELRIAINWDGGRHHAKKSAASGFCYVADAVLAIQKLRERFDGVIYVDLDLHHGDGVESAFLFSDKVLTISMHQYEAGFFPMTGNSTDHGKGRGTGYALNVPLREGLSDASLLAIVRDIVNPAIVTYARRKAAIGIVVQCGVDGLAQDPMRKWNLSINGFTRAVLALQSQADDLNCQVLYLGGGGYDRALASRCYANVTASLLGIQLEDQIPEHEHWAEYAETVYELARSSISPGLRDENLGNLPHLEQVVREHLEKYLQ